MFDQPCQRGHLPLNPETLTIGGNKPVTISGDPSKQPNEHIKTMLKNISTTIIQEACGRALTTSQALKGINQLLWTLPPLYRTSSTPFMLVSRQITPPTQRALTRLLQKRWTGRSQVVRMGNNTSSPLILNTGAPQGCVLSPLLYSLYTHDCTATHSSNVIVKFADDTTVIGLITDNDETAHREEVSTLTKWCQENHLSLNIDKTKELVVDYRRQSREHTPITIDKTPVERVSSFKFLGVHITEDLIWSAHTDAVLKKAHQRLFFLRRLRKFGTSPRILRSFYTCTVESILTGCITAWWYTGGVQGKPGGLSKTPATRPTDCSLCCPQGDVSAASDRALADWGIAFSLRLSG